MSLNRLIKEHVRVSLSDEKIYSQICKVLSIDEDKRTCQLEPINGDAERKGRIQSSLELSDGIYIKPVINSYVLLCFINKQTGVITNYSEIDTIDITIGESILNITDGLISFNGGELGGLMKIDSVLSAINRLESRIKSHQHISTSPGTPTTVDIATNPTFVNTSKSDIENTKIVQ